ncbi:MAG: HAMP domain-containing histidine kinase [Anaerolineales bacterium]|nr:HAMP domain-containing histidine kinase [Anaerolineales bacterium]
MGKLWRQLRWRIVAAQMVVVVVGVALVLLMAYVILSLFAPAGVLAELDAFRRSIFTAVSVAALGAIIAGLMTSFWLAREILRPLRQITASSQRLAHGHYTERVPVPASDELAQMAENFNQMAAALEQVEQQRVALIGNVSHELRTPLAGLNGYLEGLMDGVFPGNEETFALMDHEVRRLRRLVDDLQALSRVEAGQITLQLADFDLIPLVERVLRQLGPSAESQELQMEADFAVPSLSVRADADRVAQVLLNLVGNAIRYTPEGGRIVVEVKAAERTAVVSVSDTGVGIPAEALPYVFERFYRVDTSRTRRSGGSGGSGIGLTISRHLVWAMGGDLTAVSPGPDQGSTFNFTLPLASRPK